VILMLVSFAPAQNPSIKDASLSSDIAAATGCLTLNHSRYGASELTSKSKFTIAASSVSALSRRRLGDAHPTYIR